MKKYFITIALICFNFSTIFSVQYERKISKDTTQTPLYDQPYEQKDSIEKITQKSTTNQANIYESGTNIVGSAFAKLNPDVNYKSEQRKRGAVENPSTSDISDILPIANK